MTSETRPVPTQNPVTKTASWAGVVSLSLGIFAIVMSEFLPASLLSRMADGLHVSEGAAGQAVSVTAIAAAVSALMISVVLPHADRRHVMISLTLLAIASNVLVTFAPNLYVLLGARILLGIALGGFWAMATAMAARLVHADHVGRALTVINSGVAVATIAAVPLGSWLGEIWGWRAVFFLGAGVGVLALIAQAVTLPSVIPSAGSGLRALASVLRSRIVLIGLLAALLIFAGHFSAFTYIRPISESLNGVDAADFTLLLLIFGIASLLGTAVSGPLADRMSRVGVLLFPIAVGTGTFVMLLAGASTGGLFAAAVLWGFGFGGVPTTVLSWGARTEPARLEQIGGVIVTVANVAIAIGAVVGGILIDGASASAALSVGGSAAVIGGLVLVSLRRKRDQGPLLERRGARCPRPPASEASR